MRTATISSTTLTAQPVTLALQGGGALGAFSWGVLDRLLDEPSLDIAVASGASAGALNAAMLVQGLADGGRAEARRLLERLWRRVAVAAGSPDVDSAWFLPFATLLGPMAGALRQASRALPSASLAPAAPNPLRHVLEGLFDPGAFGRPGTPSLVVSATKLRTGEARLFRDAQVTTEVLLASSCLPQLWLPVEIEGELYWDGGYASNPPLRPLIEAGAPADVILVRTTPEERPEPPHDAADIRERSAELAFGTALRQELRSLAVAQRLLAELPEPPANGTLARLSQARLHAIGAEEALRALPNGSALDTRWGFLSRLHALGIEVADQWLEAHRDDIGQRASFDLEAWAQPLVEFRQIAEGRERPVA